MINLKAPLDIQVELLEGCNHKCIYCYNYYRNSNSDKKLSKELIKNISEQIIKNNIFNVVLTGGEPLLVKSNMFYVIDLLTQKKDIDIDLNTNLSVELSNKDIKKLTKLNTVLVSFPSINKEKFNQITKSNNYINVLKNLEKLVSEGINTAINQVVTKLNKNEVYETAKFFLENYNIRAFSATPINPSTKKQLEFILSKQEIINVAQELIKVKEDLGVDADMLNCFPNCMFPEYLRDYELTNHGCSAGKTTLTIGYDGNVRPCSHLKRSYGNISKESLSSIWEKIITQTKRIDEKCIGCYYEANCGGGCISRGETYDGKDPLINNKIYKINNKTKGKLDPKKYYSIKPFKSRPEGEERYLITDGQALVIGNKSFLDFMTEIQDIKFKINEIKELTGSEGEDLIKYLYYQDMINMCDKNEKFINY